MCLPPKHLTVDKIKVNNEILLKHILLNCVSSKNEVSNAALESLAELLMSPDLEKQNIKETVKVIFIICVSVYFCLVLGCFKL